MALLGYDAINLGEKDLQYGREFLEQMRNNYQLPFISANVYDSDTDQLFASPYLIKEIGAIKVGIFGVTTTERVESFVKAETGFKLKDPYEAARSIVAQLENKCDIVVALSHLALHGNNQLAEKVEGIDVIISGHQGYHLRSPKKVGNTLMMQPGSQGKYLGQLELKVISGKIASNDGKTVALSASIPDDPKLVNLVDEFDKELLLAFPLESPKGKIGTSKLNQNLCIACHREQFQQWNSTLHSHAWQTLVDKKQAHNPECQQCHTSLYNEPNGFSRLSDTPDMVNVQCAECHRPAISDVRTHMNRSKQTIASTNGKTNGKAQSDFKKITEQTCLKCHNEENSPQFDFAKFLAKVTH